MEDRAVKRLGVLAVCAFLQACSGGGGGPAGPAIPQVAGVYTGQGNVTVNTCTGDIGSEGIGSVVVQQTGTSISFQLAGISISGTLQASGNFTASGATVIEGINAQVSMNGSFTDDRLLASQTLVLSVPGDSCQIQRTFNMTRE
jgi:hypothetical protein